MPIITPSKLVDIEQIFRPTLSTDRILIGLRPVIKWAGGKERELAYIHQNLPNRFDGFFDPFVGGGSVYLSVFANRKYINDKSSELVALYQSIAAGDNHFTATLKLINDAWQSLEETISSNSDFWLSLYNDLRNLESLTESIIIKINSYLLNNSALFNFSMWSNDHNSQLLSQLKESIAAKLIRMRTIESRTHLLSDSDILNNIESSHKAAFYTFIRFLYNHDNHLEAGGHVRTAYFVFIRNFAYSGMFRYNANGFFNVPYGGIGYNRKDFGRIINYLSSKRLRDYLSNTTVENLDFLQFLRKHTPSRDDFVFLDPPYDSNFSTYAKNTFGQDDQKRLSEYLKHECEAKWMLIIKHTDFIRMLYIDSGLNIRRFDKNYLVSFMNRNDKAAEHLLITNY